MAIEAREGIFGHPKAPPVPKVSSTRAILRRLLPSDTAPRPPETGLSALEQQLSLDGVDTFVAQIGGRQHLIDLLTVADEAGDGDRIISLLLNPEYESWGLRQLCAHAGITVAHLLAAYKKATIVVAHIQAIHLIAAKLLPVVDDVMTRAVPIKVICPECRAQSLPSPCTYCGGTGEMLRDPDFPRQKLALELAGLIEKRGIVLNQHTAISAPAAASTTVVQGTGTLEQLHQAVGELLFSPDRRRKASPASAASPGSHAPRPQEEDSPLPPFGDPAVIDYPRDEPADPADPDADNDHADDDEEEEPQRARS